MTLPLGHEFKADDYNRDACDFKSLDAEGVRRTCGLRLVEHLPMPTGARLDRDGPYFALRVAQGYVLLSVDEADAFARHLTALVLAARSGR